MGPLLTHKISILMTCVGVFNNPFSPRRRLNGAFRDFSAALGEKQGLAFALMSHSAGTNRKPISKAF